MGLNEFLTVKMTVEEAVDEIEKLENDEEKKSNNEGYAMVLLDIGEIYQKASLSKKIQKFK